MGQQMLFLGTTLIHSRSTGSATVTTVPLKIGGGAGSPEALELQRLDVLVRQYVGALISE